MNSQSARCALAKQIIKDCKIARIIETGTFFGTTTIDGATLLFVDGTGAVYGSVAGDIVGVEHRGNTPGEEV